jgi:Serpin (serine protease inhibitor)
VTLTATDVVTPLARYARRFHAIAGSRHHVASPLGAWLLLALCAPASDGQTREFLNETLGCDVRDAAELAAGLLACPHPLVAAAAGVWHRERALSETQARWMAGLPADVQTGPLTTQAALDDWARRHTFGLIERFPIALDPSIYLVIATALATRVSWERPFDLASASALGLSSPWVTELSRVLQTPHGPGHEQFVAVTEAAGDVAVHAAWARDGLLVASVAANPSVPAGDVLAAAYDLVPALATGGRVARRSLFDLPLGEGPLWSVSETTALIKSGAAREERCTAVLPAWTARSECDLSNPELGFEAAAQALAPGDPWVAKQAAMARYTRVGFEAAAVTAMAMRMGMAMRVPRQGLVRTAELRFGHPFAVVAVTADRPGHGWSAGQDPSPWSGLPVFSAWVAQPEDAEPEDPARPS